MNRLALARAAIAIVALALILVPGEMWGAPSTDSTQRGFDPDLVYATDSGSFVYDPFVVSQQGTWQACPCPAGSTVTLSGSGLAKGRAESETGSPRLNGTQLLVDGTPARLFLVTPSQIDFQLPPDVTSTSARLELLRDGETVGEDTVAIGGSPPAEAITVGAGAIRLDTSDGAEPSAHLLTTPLSFRVQLTATVERSAGNATPLRLMFWNPRNHSSLDLVFDPAGRIVAEAHDGAGKIGRSATLGTYAAGEPHIVTLTWRRAEDATFTLDGGQAFRVTAADAPALFDAYRPSLTVVGAAHGGSSAATVSGYQLDLLPGRFTTVRTGSPLIAPLMALLTLAGLALLALSATPRSAARRAAGLAARVGAFARAHPLRLSAGAVALAAYLALNGALFSLGSQPFDMQSQATWSHVATNYGISDLYYVTQTATLADVWNGVPYHEAVFPYNAGMSYYFWAVGQTHALLFGHTSPEASSMEWTVKAFNLAFLLADAALIFAIVRHLRPAARLLPYGVVAAVLLNPAVLFDTAVWGETESVVLLPLLASLLAALKDRPGLAWSFLAVAFLSKQTVLLPVLGVALWYTLRFDFRRNVESFSGAMVAVLVLTLPFTLNGYPPSIAIDPTLAGVWAHGGVGAERAFQVVSYDALNLWTLVTYLADGASGIGRFQAPDYEPRLFSLSYRALGLVLLATSLGALACYGFARRRTLGRSPDAVFALIGAVFVLELFLPTQTLSRYYVFALVFAAIGLAGRRPVASAVALSSLTVTALVGQWGSLALVLQSFPANAPHLAPADSALSRLALDLFTSDAFITVGVALNALALGLLTFAGWRTGENEARVAVPGRLPAPAAGPAAVTLASPLHQQ